MESNFYTYKREAHPTVKLGAILRTKNFEKVYDIR